MGSETFLIGLKFLDGQGQIIQGGGKVVKNASGFDLPKFFVGSLGRYGILVETTWKVFPAPPAYVNIEAQFNSLLDLQNSKLQTGDFSD